ncbi:hypothetical protein Solca_3791 [Solitalea canadensis DSM 3403]|uniref:Uncharacterized protein n=1 Tax=Solitalea canadensis (strain ATCC 29591 / DSM 3403 / JCM 21819 / LMG 8368 / NBRC 15130 / NCIMB 12057 / USAM 9D) TaxID=929556 RepID=H8KKX4_SOLCM|nr:hypothetical protein Solca_3791 [Solitalea canadensis DSM 3403]
MVVQIKSIKFLRGNKNVISILLVCVTTNFTKCCIKQYQSPTVDYIFEYGDTTGKI